MATLRGAVLAFMALLALSASAWAADDGLRAKALKLNEVTGTEPTTAKLRELLKSPDDTKKLLVLATAMAKEKEQPFNVNATILLARAAHGLREFKTSEQFYRLNLNQAIKLQSPHKMGAAFNGLAQLLFDNKKYAESQKVCQEFLDLDVDEESAKELATYRFPMTRRLVLCLARQNEVEKAKKILDVLIDENKQNWLLLEVKAQVLREADDYEGASKLYETMLDKIDKDERIKDKEKQEFSAEIKYTLSGVYIEMKLIDKATEALRALLKDEPDNATYNNDLGYIMADHDKNLDEAEKLIRKAIDDDRKARKKDNADLKPEDDKDNASYVDSLGWVLFKKKKFKEAKEQLEKAVKDEDGKHIEIYDHLGEVCLALGDKKGAVEAWKKGVEVAGSTKREIAKKAEVEKKIKEKE